MIIEVIQILPDGPVKIKLIESSGQFPEKSPEEGEKYIVYFEKYNPDPTPEFNR